MAMEGVSLSGIRVKVAMMGGEFVGVPETGSQVMKTERYDVI
jgi:hypothetical protein